MIHNAGGLHPLQQQGGYSIPPMLKETLRKDPRNHPCPQWEAALAYVRAGFPIAAVYPSKKNPEGGWSTATTDY